MTSESGLKDKARAVAYWTLPKGIQNAAKMRFGPFLGDRQGRPSTGELALNREFLGCHQGQRCFILATGPSIRKQALSRLAGELCISVSQFMLHPDIAKIAPKYHVEAPLHPPFGFDDAEKIFRWHLDLLPRETVSFIGHRDTEHSFFNFLRRRPEMRPHTLRWLSYQPAYSIDEHNQRDSRIWDLTRALFGPRTVIYSAIQLAAYMGVAEIYLLGCDHDYLADVKRVTNHHFYKEEAGLSDVKQLSSFSSERWFEEYYFRWKEYRLMAEALAERGCRIFNSTEGGMLDVFPRASLETVLATAKPALKSASP